MNFRNRKNKKRKKDIKFFRKVFNKKTFKIIGKSVLTVFLIGVITCSILAASLTIYIFGFVDGSLDFDLVSLKLNLTSFVYADNPKTGQPERLGELHATENRIWVDYDKIPQKLKDAFISIEDQRFLKHDGVDWKRTILSFVNVFIKFYDNNPGGSTITQQLVRGLTQDTERTFRRKIQEIVRAINLEQHSSKDEILEAYLNTLYLGNGCYGVQAAANRYFGKNIDQLSLAEIASLAGITRSPEKHNPVDGFENNRKRQRHVLYKMNELGYISDEEYQAALQETLVIAPPKPKKYNSYYVDQVITDVINDLMGKKGYSKQKAEDLVYRGGLNIYTAMNKEIQDILESVYLDPSNFPKLKGEEQPQSAMVIMDYDGRVVAMVGGRGEKTGNRVLNRATQSVRQPGSAIKPLSVYAPALEINLINYSSKVMDQPMEIVEEGKTKKWPLNYTRTYSGEIFLDDAIQRSVNTVPARLCWELTPRHCFNFLTEKLHFSTLVPSKKINGKVFTDIGLSAMGIGGMTEGVTVLEMAAGYQIFGNGGYYNKPYTYTKVTDKNGDVLLKNNVVSTSAISGDTSVIMNKLLQTVITGPRGTGRSAKFSDMPLIGKTGTTTDDKDRWFVGASPYYVGVVWFGYDMPKTITGVSSNPALKVWKTVMSKVHAKLPVKDFPNDLNVVSELYCTVTGEIATPDCPSVARGWYKKDSKPKTCQTHLASQQKDVKESDSNVQEQDSSKSSGGQSPQSQDVPFIEQEDMHSQTTEEAPLQTTA